MINSKKKARKKTKPELKEAGINSNDKSVIIFKIGIKKANL